MLRIICHEITQRKIVPTPKSLCAYFQSSIFSYVNFCTIHIFLTKTLHLFQKDTLTDQCHQSRLTNVWLAFEMKGKCGIGIYTISDERCFANQEDGTDNTPGILAISYIDLSLYYSCLWQSCAVVLVQKSDYDCLLYLWFAEYAADFETAVRATSFGRFNLILLLSCIPCSTSVIMDTNSLSYIIPTAECDLQLTPERKGIMNAVTYVGERTFYLVLQLPIWQQCSRPIPKMQVSSCPFSTQSVHGTQLGILNTLLNRSVNNWSNYRQMNDFYAWYF